LPDGNDVNAVPTTLDEILRDVWSRLERGMADPQSALQSAALATQSPAGPAVRTVVLRAVDESARTLTCHTDKRSSKVADLATDARVAWMFYDPDARLQMRLCGSAVIHDSDARAEKRWRSAPPVTRRYYCTVAPPGSELRQSDTGLIPGLESRDPTMEESERYGRPHFVVLDTEVERIDWLWLPGNGHRRARFVWEGTRWVGTWCVP